MKAKETRELNVRAGGQHALRALGFGRSTARVLFSMNVWAIVTHLTGVDAARRQEQVAPIPRATRRRSYRPSNAPHT